MVSRDDYDLIVKSGMCVIDCSWNKIETITQTYDHERILPYLLASNNVNYGVPFQLSCAEALAAGLFLAGFEE